MHCSIAVKTSNNGHYDIHTGSGLISSSSLPSILPNSLREKHFIIVTDDNVAPLYLDIVRKALGAKERSNKISNIILPAGEYTKTMSYLEKLLDEILELGADRSSVLIALGGGVIGDITGFAASVYMRGIDWMQFPTTLLAQIDSSIGGKTGVNLSSGKNMAGSFYQPMAVIADIDTLSTLPKKQILAGYAEGIKHAIIADRDLFFECMDNAENILALDNKAIEKFIIDNCKIKANIVQLDEKESGQRKLLNFGHSFGHAIENICGYNPEIILHGEAVAIGMNMAFNLSVRLGYCHEEDYHIYDKHIKSLGLKTRVSDIFLDTCHDKPDNFDARSFLEIMRRDKKNKSGYLSLILSQGIGNAIVEDIYDEDAVLQSIELFI